MKKNLSTDTNRLIIRSKIIYSKVLKNIKIYTLCIGLLLVLFSCKQKISEKQKESFDTDLQSKNDSLLSLGKYESVIRLNIEYLKKAGKMEYREGKGLCYLNIAGVNSSAINYERALFFFRKAEKDLLNSENAYHKVLFYDTYSRYYYHLKLYDKALAYNDKSLYYLKYTKNSKFSNEFFPKLLLNRGVYFGKKGWFGTSLKYLLKANELEDSAFSNCMVTRYYLFSNHPELAGIYIQRAQEKMQIQKTNDEESIFAYYTIGCFYNETGNYKEAEKNLKKALEINIKMRYTHPSHIGELYKALAEVYKKMHKEDKAYYYLLKYTKEKGRVDAIQFSTLNKIVDDFIAETKNESDLSKNKLPLSIALAIVAISISGVYVRKIINKLRLKKRSLKKETDELKNHVQTKQFQEVVQLVKKNDSSFLLKFKELYPDFIGILLKINPDLENSELAFCAMLKLGLSSKEIADYTFVQHKSVQQKKYRIRKRLNIPADEDIYEFFDRLQ